jgi:hypothetical protein
MPKAFFLVFLMVIIACKQKEVGVQNVVKPKAIKQNTLNKAKPSPISIDTILGITEGFVNKQHFSIQRTMQGKLYVFNAQMDTVFHNLGSDYDYVSDAKFEDFNKDGYKDIIISYPQNVPGIEGLLLYNKAAKTFKKVVGFEGFPAPEAIPGTRYYYSYHHSGCADMDWTSDLFYIDSYKPVKIATIEGYDCADSGIKDGLYIYKKSGEKKTLLSRLSIKTINNYKDHKWGFIKAYWYKNYKLFK